MISEVRLRGLRVTSSNNHGLAMMFIGFGLLAAATFAGPPASAVGMAVGVAAATVLWHKQVLRWPVITGLILAVALFVPFSRYRLPVELPFGVDVYRLVVLVAVMLWVTALLADSSVRLRRSPFDIQLAVIVAATLGSVAINGARVAPLESVVMKAVTLFLSFILVFYMIVSVVRSRDTVEKLAKFLVSGAAVVSVFAIVEQRSGFNIFDHLSQVLPLTFEGRVETERDGLVRAVASSEQPIALGVFFAMTVPIGMALAYGSSRRWWTPTLVIMLGIGSTLSRTPLLAIGAAGLVLIWLRPRDVRRLLPLTVPLIVAVKIALPGSIVTLKNAFFPPGGLVEQQAVLVTNADPFLAGGRIRQLGPALGEAARTPFLGQGVGTRQTGFHNPLRNAPILDNEWLSLLLEVGLVGLAGWVALIVGAIAGLGRASRIRAGPDGWLAAGFAASIAAFGVSMFTLDSLTFGQITFVFWFVLALSASLLLIDAGKRHVSAK